MSLFEVKPYDREVYEKELKDFLPQKILDVHTHVYLKEFFPPKPLAPGEVKRTVTWPSLVAADDSIEDLQETYRLMLPGKDGWQICRDIRKKSSVPIIMLTAKGETADKINGLDMGADDYVTKPFDVKELLARVHAVMRRTDADAPVEKKLTFDKLVINLESYELIVDGVKIDTPPKEMELLYHLAASPNRVFTRNQLLDEVWGFDYFGDSRTVDVHVKRLREKIEGVSPKWELTTVWGVGYKFKVNEE